MQKILFLLLIWGITTQFLAAQNVGIGISNPTSKLHIKGVGTTATTSSLNATDDANVSHFFVEDDGKIGMNTATPITGLHLISDEGLLATGVFGGGNALNLGAGTRMHFYPKKGAFRAGYVNGTQWNDANIGNYSVAAGYACIANADYAVSLGINNQATGVAATAMGANTIASGWGATTLGSGNLASGVGAFSVGENCQALGESSIAMGHLAKATTHYSTAIGTSVEANASYTFATNYQSKANGMYSIAMGNQSIVNGSSSAAIGELNSVLSYNSFGIGTGVKITSYRSFAIGNEAESNGGISFSIGTSTIANGGHSMALGSFCVANGDFSTALGIGNHANGVGSMAMGNSTFALGPYSTTLGDSTVAVGNMSTAIGQGGIAQGNNTTVIGYRAKTYANYAIAMGTETKGYGAYSTVMGLFTSTASFAETAIGCYNTNYNASSATVYDATDRLFVIGNGQADYQRSDAMVVLKNGNTTHNGIVTVNGIICSTSGTIISCSDIRYKQNILPLSTVLESTLEHLSTINGYYYNFRGEEFPEKNFPATKQIGFIAQEVEKVYPELVTTDEKGYKGVDYAKMTPILVEAIKELKAENTDLKAKIEALEKAVYGNEQR